MSEQTRMLPDELKEARAVLGLSQQALADLLSVRQDTVARWESGRDPIPYAVPGELDALAVKRVEEIRDHFRF